MVYIYHQDWANQCTIGLWLILLGEARVTALVTVFEIGTCVLQTEEVW